MVYKKYNYLDYQKFFQTPGREYKVRACSWIPNNYTILMTEHEISYFLMENPSEEALLCEAPHPYLDGWWKMGNEYYHMKQDAVKFETEQEAQEFLDKASKNTEKSGRPEHKAFWNLDI